MDYSSDDMEDIEYSNIIYGKRHSQPPEKYTDLIFLKGSNNGYCVGREIDQYERNNIHNEPIPINQSIDIDWTDNDSDDDSDDDDSDDDDDYDDYDDDDSDDDSDDEI